MLRPYASCIDCDSDSSQLLKLLLESLRVQNGKNAFFYFRQNDNK